MIPSERSLNWLRINIPFNDEHYEGAYALCEAALKLDNFIEEAVNAEKQRCLDIAHFWKIKPKVALEDIRIGREVYKEKNRVE